MSRPARRQASRMVAPSRTRTASPSISSSTVRLMRDRDGRSRGSLRLRTPAGSPMADSMALAAVWPSPQIDASRIAWAISSSSASLVGDAAARAVGGEPEQRLLLAHGADAAGHALAARLVAEERGDAEQDRHQVDGLVEHHAPRPSRASRRPRAWPRTRARGRACPGRRTRRPRRRAARPAASLAAGDAAGQVEQLAQRDAERHLVQARALDAPGQAEQLRAGRLLGADAGERGAALEQDVRAR